MNCPNCDHDVTRVLETRPREDGDLRYRRCMKCAHRFPTMERVCVNNPGAKGYLDAPALRVVPEPQQPAKAPAKAARAARVMPDAVPDGFGITADAAPLLLQWWRESRRSKHGSRATWTEAAWLSSASRVGALPPARQLELCTAGVENGWMALKEDYLGAHKPLGLSQISRRPMPKDPAMLAALEEPWPA
jgi:hypothetical protein